MVQKSEWKGRGRERKKENTLLTNNLHVSFVLSFLGTSVPKGTGYGKLVMLDRETLEIQKTMSKFKFPIGLLFIESGNSF